MIIELIGFICHIFLQNYVNIFVGTLNLSKFAELRLNIDEGLQYHNPCKGSGPH